MSTPNLQIAHIATNQASKEIVANAAFDQLDEALTQQFTKALSDADYTLADNPPVSSEARYNLVFVFTGALTADRHIILPATEKLYIISNQTSGGHNLIIETPGGVSPFYAGASVAVPNLGSESPFVTSDYVMLYCDGTNVLPLTALPLGIFSEAPATSSSTGVAGQVAYDSAGNFFLCYATNAWAKFSGTTSF